LIALNVLIYVILGFTLTFRVVTGDAIKRVAHNATRRVTSHAVTTLTRT